MAIPNEEIERVKESIKLSEVIRARGVELKRKGKQLFGICPFHSEDSPSLAVDDEKGLWNCLGKCATGGDVFSFIQKADGINFKEAFSQVQSLTFHPASQKSKPAMKPSEPPKANCLYLEKAVTYYHKTLLQNEKAIAYLQSRGISAEAIRTFKLGYVDGSLKDKLNPDGKESLETIGLLNKKGNETMFGSVVFPLLDANTNKTVSLYARHLEKKQHLYLSGKRRGIFNPAGAKETDEIIITESVIDALSLWSLGVRNVTCAYGVNGLTDEIVEHLAESRIKKVVLMLDADETGREAVGKFAEKLAEKGIESRACFLPAKDASEFVANGGTLEQVQSLMSKVETPKIEETKPTISKQEDGSLLIELENRSYKVRGLSPIGLEKLKINLRLNVGNNFHLDTLDLYQSRARANFAQSCAKLEVVSNVVEMIF
jgi:DNA primase catalytic core